MRSIRISQIQFQQKKGKKGKNKNADSAKDDNCNPTNLGAKTQLSECGCYGKLHAVYTTCIHCGRLACEQERELVESRRECIFCRSELSGGESGDRLPRGICGDEEIAHYYQALERRDRLLEYARSSASRTRVVDEETDWFSEFENPWNTREERLLALRMSKECAENAAKRKTMINVDIEKRQITIDEGYMARSAQHYAKLLEEFEQRREARPGSSSDKVDANVEEVLNVLGGRLKFRDEARLEGGSRPAVASDQSNEFLPLEVDDSVWSDLGD
ncbi:hypothetical protein OIY81_1105 [Cryptosporidium canis]|nr:hypothetical protein OIY81_1105 [Cryptosporidium canis]